MDLRFVTTHNPPTPTPPLPPQPPALRLTSYQQPRRRHLSRDSQSVRPMFRSGPVKCRYLQLIEWTGSERSTHFSLVIEVVLHRRSSFISFRNLCERSYGPCPFWGSLPPKKIVNVLPFLPRRFCLLKQRGPFRLLYQQLSQKEEMDRSSSVTEIKWTLHNFVGGGIQK